MRCSMALAMATVFPRAGIAAQLGITCVLRERESFHLRKMGLHIKAMDEH